MLITKKLRNFYLNALTMYWLLNQLTRTADRLWTSYWHHQSRTSPSPSSNTGYCKSYGGNINHASGPGKSTREGLINIFNCSLQQSPCPKPLPSHVRWLPTCGPGAGDHEMVLQHIKAQIPRGLDQRPFIYSSNRSTDDSISVTSHILVMWISDLIWDLHAEQLQSWEVLWYCAESSGSQEAAREPEQEGDTSGKLHVFSPKMLSLISGRSYHTGVHSIVYFFSSAQL